MAKFQAPEGYILDENTCLYYTQVVAEDDAGNMAQVVTWFDANTGEYRQDVYPIKDNTSIEENKAEKPVETPKKTKKKSKAPLIICLVALLVAVGVLAFGYLKLGWFAGLSTDVLSEETFNPGDVSKPNGLIEIFIYDDGFATLVCHTDLLEGTHVKHLSFYMGDYSISVDDWDDKGSITQCSIWKKNEDTEENVSYSYVADANYNINDPVIAIEADLTQIADLEMTDLVDDISVHVEYYEDGHNYNFDYNINDVVSFVFRNGN